MLGHIFVIFFLMTYSVVKGAAMKNSRYFNEGMAYRYAESMIKCPKEGESTAHMCWAILTPP